MKFSCVFASIFILGLASLHAADSSIEITKGNSQSSENNSYFQAKQSVYAGSSLEPYAKSDSVVIPETIEKQPLSSNVLKEALNPFFK